MQFRKKTVFSLFSSKSQFIIPDYQRTFSWEKDQCEVFFDDLYEQSKSPRNYFFGNILLEENNEIVDGQQRLTTIVIFICSLINVLEEQKKRNTKILILKIWKEHLLSAMENQS